MADDLGAVLAGIRERASQLTGDGHNIAECTADLGGPCTGHDAERLADAVEAALAQHEMEVRWPLAVMGRDTHKDDPKVYCGHAWADILRDADAGLGIGGHDMADDGTDAILCMDRDRAEEVCGGACSEDDGAGPVPWPCPTYAAITAALLGEEPDHA